MAITYVGGNSNGRAGSTGTNLVVSLNALTGGSDSQPSAGDLVIVTWGVGANGDYDLNVVTAGYTRIVDLYSNDDNDANLWVAYKFMTSTPDGDVTLPPSSNANHAITASVHVWRGVDTSTIFDVTKTEATGINGGRPTPPAITPTTSGSIIVCAASAAAASTTAFTTSDLSNFQTIEFGDSISSVSGIGSYAWSSGTFTPAQWGGNTTVTSASWCACSLALRPALSSTKFLTLLGVG